MAERRLVEKGSNFRGNTVWADVLPEGQDNLTKQLRQINSGFNQFIVHSKALCYQDDQNLERATAHCNLLGMVAETSQKEITALFGNTAFSAAPIEIHFADGRAMPYLIFGKMIGQNESEYNRLLEHLANKANEIIYPLSGGYGLIPGKIIEGASGSEPGIGGS